MFHRDTKIKVMWIFLWKLFESKLTQLKHISFTQVKNCVGISLYSESLHIGQGEMIEVLKLQLFVNMTFITVSLDACLICFLKFSLWNCANCI